MEWQTILEKARLIKEEYNRSHKCLNIDRPIGDETLQNHFEKLLSCIEKVRILFNVNYNRLTKSHQVAADAFFLDLTTKTFKLATRKGVIIDLPRSIHEHSVSIFKQLPKIPTMNQTIVEFLNTASKLIIEFDGKSENLRSFIDSLHLVESIKSTHEAIAVSLIKTKLKGNARNLINNESTISEIISKLNCSVKGESVEVLTAKIMNTKQNNKPANNYCNEIENLTKSLENAYISDGLSCELAGKYSTQIAVKALTKNCTIDKVKLIMEAGQFNNMNDAISKFINSCTEITGQQNAVLHFGNRPNKNNFRGNYTKFRGRNNFPRNNNNNRFGYNNNNNSSNSNYNNRNRQRYNNYRRNNYIHATGAQENDSENSNQPLRSIQ